MDLKNRLIDFSGNDKVRQHSQALFNTSWPTVLKNYGAARHMELGANFNNQAADALDSNHLPLPLSVQSIEDATGRLSNLVRLMDEQSKLLQ